MVTRGTALALVVPAEAPVQGVAGLAPEGTYPSPLRAAYVLSLLVLACVIAYVDIQVFSLQITPIKAALTLSDSHIGLLQGIAFNFSAGLAGLAMGLLIDRGNRVQLLFRCALGWSLFTALTGLATSFWPLFVCRAGVGIAEAGLYPLAYSLIADLYPPKTRVMGMLTFFGSVLFVGSFAIALGGVAIGVIDAHAKVLPWGISTIAAWRLTFFAASTPGVILALFFLAAREPQRHRRPGDTDADGRETTFRTYLRANWRTLVPLFSGLQLATLGAQALLFWMPTMLARAFGYSVAMAGEYFGLAFGVGSISGTIAAAILSRFLARRWGDLASLQVARTAASLIALVLPLALLARSATALLVFATCFVALCYIATSISPNLQTMVAPNHLRGRIFTIVSLFGLVSSTTSPPLIGILSDHVFHGPRGLILAFTAFVFPCSLVSPLLLMRVTESFRRTVNSAQVPLAFVGSKP